MSTKAQNIIAVVMIIPALFVIMGKTMLYLGIGTNHGFSLEQGILGDGLPNFAGLLAIAAAILLKNKSKPGDFNK